MNNINSDHNEKIKQIFAVICIILLLVSVPHVSVMAQDDIADDPGKVIQLPGSQADDPGTPDAVLDNTADDIDSGQDSGDLINTELLVILLIIVIVVTVLILYLVMKRRSRQV